MKYSEFPDKRKILEEYIDQFLKSFFTYSPNSIWVLDSDFNFVYLNSACEQLISYRKEEFTNLSISKIVHPKTIEMTVERFHKSIYDKVENFESTLINRYGHSIEVNVTNIPIIVDNKIIGIYSIINERTEFKQNERKETVVEQKHSENKFRSVFESSNDAIILTDDDMRIIAWNKAAELIFGYEEREVLGERLEFMIPERFREGHKRGVERYRSTGEAKVIGKTVELFGLHREGHEFPIELTLNTWKDGADLFFSAIIRDVTERQKAQELFLNSEKLSIVGQLAAGIAHEIRNPLTAIKGFIQLLQSQSNESQYFDIISSEMDRIETILNELLVLAKPQATKYVRQDVIAIMTSVVTLFETQGNLNNIQIVEEYVATDRFIECDENQIKQVFINFMKNSMEAMNTGGGKITLYVSNEKADSILIRIMDEGCGIPSSVLERLGEPFYSTKEKGTGLGMMVSNKIIKDHKGKVNIMSEVNKGTTIEIRFPVSKEELVPPLRDLIINKNNYLT